MAECTIDSHITKPCDLSGAGGIRNLWAIDAKHIVNYTKNGCEVTSLTLQTLPTPQLFWRIELVGEDSGFTDTTTDSDAGAFYATVQGEIRIAKTAVNRCIEAKIYGAKLVFLIELNNGIFELAGLTGKGVFAGGMRLVQRTEGTFASTDKGARYSDKLLFRSEETLRDGLQIFQVPIPDHDITNTYSVGDIVYDSVNQCYFQAKNAGVLSALPACGNSNADWAWLKDEDAKKLSNMAYLAPLINP